MADEPTQLTRDDFIAFLKDRNAESPCEACGTNSWSTVVDTDKRSTIALPVASIDDGSLRNGVNMFALICNNCSNTRLFWRITIERWKTARLSDAGGAQ